MSSEPTTLLTDIHAHESSSGQQQQCSQQGETAHLQSARDHTDEPGGCVMHAFSGQMRPDGWRARRETRLCCSATLGCFLMHLCHDSSLLLSEY